MVGPVEFSIDLEVVFEVLDSSLFFVNFDNLLALLIYKPCVPFQFTLILLIYLTRLLIKTNWRFQLFKTNQALYVILQIYYTLPLITHLQLTTRRLFPRNRTLGLLETIPMSFDCLFFSFPNHFPTDLSAAIYKLGRDSTIIFGKEFLIWSAQKFMN
jgi:hypothetical protein